MKRLHWYLWLGIGILVFLSVSYFIPITADTGSNYIVKSSLLGKIIFYNAWVLLAYILLSAVLILAGIRHRISRV